MSILQSLYGRMFAMVFHAVCSAVPLVIAGCSDALPPSSYHPVEDSTIVTSLVFNDTVGRSVRGEQRPRIRITSIDGAAGTDITEGVLLGPVGRNRIAFSLPQNRVRVATWRAGAWEINDIETAWPSAFAIPPSSISISPDGELLTYSVSQRVVGDSIYVATYLKGADGSGMDMELPVSAINGCTPVFSRDGRKMAFYGVERSLIQSNETAATVYIVDTWARTYKAVGSVKSADASLLSWLDFSPDGSRIVYTDAATGELYIANTDGIGIPRLLNQRGVHPVWSPNGDRIMYLSQGKSDIMMMNADGSGTVVNLTNSPQEYDLYPQFSPDGEHISYTSYSHDTRITFGTAKLLSIRNPSQPGVIGTGIRKVFWIQTNR